MHPAVGQFVAASISSVEELMQHPMALPVAVGVVTVFLTILLFYNISESLKKKAAGKGDETGAEVGEARRSTRCEVVVTTIGCGGCFLFYWLTMHLCLVV